MNTFDQLKKEFDSVQHRLIAAENKADRARVEVAQVAESLDRFAENSASIVTTQATNAWKLAASVADKLDALSRRVAELEYAACKAEQLKPQHRNQYAPGEDKFGEPVRRTTTITMTEYDELKADAEKWRLYTTPLGADTPMSRAIEETHADAELGRLVREMPAGMWLKHLTGGHPEWRAGTINGNWDCDTPEESLRAAQPKPDSSTTP